MPSLIGRGEVTGGDPLRLSIVVCAFDEAPRLEACLRSLLAQDLAPADYEIVVVDDGSADETAAIAERVLFADRGALHRRFVRIRHGGLSAARNTGIARSRSRLIAFIDGDAEAEPDWARRVVDAFAERPDVGVVGGRIRHLNTDSRAARFLHAIHYDASDAVDVIGCNMACRREVFERVGGFHSCFTSRGDETSLIDRVRADGSFRIVKIDDAVVRHERPASIRAWLKERWANGRCYAWCERLSRDNGWIMRQCAKRCVTLSPFVLLPVALFGPWYAVAIAPGLLCIARRQRGRRMTRIREERSLATSIGGVVLNVLGDASSDWGYLRGAREVPGPRGSRADVAAAPIVRERSSEDPAATRPLACAP